MRSRPERAGVRAPLLLAALALLVGACLEPPAEERLRGGGIVEGDVGATSLDDVEDLHDLTDVERHAVRITLRVRNLGCERIALGSGFAIDSDTLVTNRHVIEGADRLEVNTWDGRRLTVEVARAATAHDLALVRVAGTLPEVAVLADDDPLSGDEVVVASHPGGGPLAVRRGQVRGETDDVLFGSADGAVVLDVGLEPGSSGAAVLDRDGRVVGVVYAASADRTASFAVPASSLRAIEDADLEGVPGCPGT